MLCWFLGHWMSDTRCSIYEEVPTSCRRCGVKKTLRAMNDRIDDQRRPDVDYVEDLVDPGPPG